MVELPKPSPDVVHQRLEDEVVLVHLRTNQIYALNETGARLWELIVDGADRAGVEQALLAEFDVAPDELRAEIDRLLGELAAVDAVRPA